MIIHSAKKKKKTRQKERNSWGGGERGDWTEYEGGWGLATLCQLFEHYLTRT